MPQQPQQRPGISQISHLFLSGVRQKHGQPAPVRTPPPRTDPSVDLTPEEFAHVFGQAEQPHAPIGPVQAVLACHLGPAQLAKVQEYAAHVCPVGQRLGLIVVDASELRVSVFEHNPHPSATAEPYQETDVLDAHKMNQALEELAWDVDSWLVHLPTPRAPEARSLLRALDQWTVLTSCDQEGLVACYRTLKGLADLDGGKPGSGPYRPRLCLAAVNAAGASAESAYQRLAGVCRQFLNWPVQSLPPVMPASDVVEHVVFWYRALRDKAQLAAAPQWQLVANFLARTKSPPQPQVVQQTIHQLHQPPEELEPPSAPSQADEAYLPEVFELPESADESSIIQAFLHSRSDLVPCPVAAPACPQATLAVDRDRRLVMLAVTHPGLQELDKICRAYQWLVETRSLLTMALPQLTIDAHQIPRLLLLIDHLDASAQALQPILHGASVTVHVYRRLRWGKKTGLLLEAA